MALDWVNDGHLESSSQTLIVRVCGLNGALALFYFRCFCQAWLIAYASNYSYDRIFVSSYINTGKDTDYLRARRGSPKPHLFFQHVATSIAVKRQWMRGMRRFATKKKRFIEPGGACSQVVLSRRLSIDYCSGTPAHRCSHSVEVALLNPSGTAAALPYR